MAGNENDVFKEKVGQQEKWIIYSLGEVCISQGG